MALPQDVQDWLGAKFEEYYESFSQGGYVTLEKCSAITEESLMQIGIVKPGHRKRLLTMVKALQEDKGSSGPPPVVARKPPVVPPKPSAPPAKMTNSNDLAPPPIVPRTRSQGAAGQPPARPPPPLSYGNNTTNNGGGGKPRCQGGRGGCRGIVLEGTRLCKAHTCTMEGCFKTKGSKEKFCVAHRPLPKAPGDEEGPAHDQQQPQAELYGDPEADGDSKGSGGAPVVRGESRDDGEYVAVPLSRGMGVYSRVQSPQTSPASRAPELKRVNLKVLRPDERKLEGYLLKKGGKLGNKGWDRRYFRLQDGKLCYYQDENESKPLGNIPLRDMVDTGPSGNDGAAGRHGHRFQLETKQRTWFFAAESVKEFTEWMMTLKAMIMTYKPSEEDAAIGGRMANPDLAGWIKLKGSEFIQSWHRRYFAVKNGSVCLYQSYEDYVQDDPMENIDCKLLTVKVGASGAKRTKHQFQLVTNMRSFEMQAETKEDMNDLIQAIQNNILWALEQMTSGDITSAAVGADKIKKEDVLQELYVNQSNRFCAECGAPDPSWASISLGIMFCIGCSGCHRGLGVHISKVRSVTLDEWTRPLIDIVVKIGNERSNAFWEASMPEARKPKDDSAEGTKFDFIRDKYKDRKFLKSTDGQDGPAQLSSLLVDVVTTEKLNETVQLVTRGVSKGTTHPTSGKSMISVAKAAGQAAQCELLTQLGFTPIPGEDDQQSPATNTGEGSGRDGVGEAPVEVSSYKGWVSADSGTRDALQRYFCVLDLGLLSYYDNETEENLAGTVAVAHMTGISAIDSGMASATASSLHWFEIRTVDSRFALGVDSTEERTSWVNCLQANLDALPANTKFDFASCPKAGNLRYTFDVAKEDFETGFFAVRGKQLLYFHDENDDSALGAIELGDVTAITKGPGNYNCSEPEDHFFHLNEDNPLLLQTISNEETDEWLMVLRNTRVFGASIESNSTVIPTVVEKCCFFIETHGLFLEGIYRKSGNKIRVKELRQKFDKDDQLCEINPQRCQAHDVATVLKQYFQQLPDPLFTRARQPQFLEVIKNTDHNQMLYGLQDLIDSLPTSNYETLKRMCVHMSLITEHESANKMTVPNIAIVFAPTLFGDCDGIAGMQGSIAVMEKLITYHEWIFRIEEKTAVDEKIQEARKQMEAASASRNDSKSQVTVCDIYDAESGEEHALALKADMPASQVVKLMLDKAKKPAAEDWAIVESVSEGALSRALEDHELVHPNIFLWDEPMVLKLARNPSKQFLWAAAGQVMSGYVHLKVKSNKWKKVWAICDASGAAQIPALYFYKEKNNVEQGRILLEKSNVYAATPRKKDPVPHVFAVRPMGVRNIDDASCRYCGVETKADMDMWIATLTVAKAPSKYIKGGISK